MRSLRDFANRESRALVRMYRRHGDQVLQPYPTTFEDRYPAVFDALASHLVHIPEPQILSYGCSDGSEVRSLRRWFPHARIVGLDPNALMIGKAREHLARHPDAGINYVEASSPSALCDMRF
ncbi:MAG: class I SAM-dependent methyltransferase, partial [Pseudomonadota bacterium]